jgi:adenosylhomocysteine nucleosidase
MTDDSSAPIGMIAAMNEECRPLLRRVQGWEKCRVGAFPGFRFRLAGRDCLLVQSGIGQERAGAATRALVAALLPRRLISFGVAGAVQAGLQIGDVVSVRRVMLLERGIPGPVAPLAVLSGAAQAAVDEVLQAAGRRFIMGSALTTRGSQVIKSDLSAMENPVLEMETAAVARAAVENGVPLIGLRGISDNPEEPLPVDPDAVMDENYHLQAGRLLRALIRRPGIILQANRMRCNTAMAAENVARAVIAAIENL